MEGVTTAAELDPNPVTATTENRYDVPVVNPVTVAEAVVLTPSANVNQVPVVPARYCTT